MFSLSPVLLEETALGIILGIVLVLFIVMSFIFSYHWKRFGIPTTLFSKMSRAYFLFGITLATLSILLYGFILFSF